MISLTDVTKRLAGLFETRPALPADLTLTAEILPGRSAVPEADSVRLNTAILHKLLPECGARNTLLAPNYRRGYLAVSADRGNVLKVFDEGVSDRDIPAGGSLLEISGATDPVTRTFKPADGQPLRVTFRDQLSPEGRKIVEESFRAIFKDGVTFQTEHSLLPGAIIGGREQPASAAIPRALETVELTVRSREAEYPVEDVSKIRLDHNFNLVTLKIFGEAEFRKFHPQGQQVEPGAKYFLAREEAPLDQFIALRPNQSVTLSPSDPAARNLKLPGDFPAMAAIELSLNGELKTTLKANLGVELEVFRSK